MDEFLFNTRNNSAGPFSTIIILNLEPITNTIPDNISQIIIPPNVFYTSLMPWFPTILPTSGVFPALIDTNTGLPADTDTKLLVDTSIELPSLSLILIFDRAVLRPSEFLNNIYNSIRVCSLLAIIFLLTFFNLIL